MPYVLPVEGGELIRIVGPQVETPGRVVSEAWVAGLDEEERAAMGFVWADDTADEVEAKRATVIAAVREEARARISGRYPPWQQDNMQMRATELVDLRQDRALTEDEEAERQALKAAAAWIKDVRAASNAIEADLPWTVAELAALDIGAHPAWPA